MQKSDKNKMIRVWLQNKQKKANNFLSTWFANFSFLFLLS